MADPRIEKLAKVLVHYSLELKPKQQFSLRSSPLANDITLAVYEEAVKAGAHVFTRINLPGFDELFFKYANDEQLDYISPLRKMIVETFDAELAIGAEYNTRYLSGTDPAKMARVRKASAPLSKLYMERAAKLELRWCYTEFPTQASAQEADMSFNDYQDFVFNSGLLNEHDPVEAWKEEGIRQMQIINWLKGRDKVSLKGEFIDLNFSIKGRSFKECDGKNNFPDGEIFTTPVENSANGWVRFSYPAIYDGQEVIDVELWFENGKVVKEKASKGQELLTTTLNTDSGSRIIGEWGIGTNYGIQRFTKNMLFDEKIGGTIHLALGACYPETGGVNDSGIHWDMLCDMSKSEILVDGDTFYRNGKFAII